MVRPEPYRVERKTEELLARLHREGTLRWEDIVRTSESKSEVTAAFLALLELCRRGKIHLDGGDGQPLDHPVRGPKPHITHNHGRGECNGANQSGERPGGHPLRPGRASGGGTPGPGPGLYAPRGGGGLPGPLAQRYVQTDAGLRPLRMEHRWQMVSAPQYGERIQTLLARKKPDKLSPAALETLALVAYFQPVTRAYLDQARGWTVPTPLALFAGPGAGGPLRPPGRPGAPVAL